MGRDFGAVAVLGGAGDDGFDGMIDLRHVLEELVDLLLFEEELLFVGEVLVLATAAIAEEGAGGFGAVG